MSDESEDSRDEERLIEAISAILGNAPDHRMQVTNLLKALFYLDLIALRDTGHTLTNSTYVALENGPVVQNYPRHIRELSEAGIVRQDIEGMAKPVVLLKERESYHFMDDHLRGEAARLGELIARKTATEMSAFSHSAAWRIAFARGVGKPINMAIAMQQTLDNDPWLHEPMDEAEEDAADLVDARAHEATPWS